MAMAVVATSTTKATKISQPSPASTRAQSPEPAKHCLSSSTNCHLHHISILNANLLQKWPLFHLLPDKPTTPLHFIDEKVELGCIRRYVSAGGID
ncbi:hypothetical protein LINPERPRIM_LOCUS2348, partial [Linum perenne]